MRIRAEGVCQNQYPNGFRLATRHSVCAALRQQYDGAHGATRPTFPEITSEKHSIRSNDLHRALG